MSRASRAGAVLALAVLALAGCKSRAEQPPAPGPPPAVAPADADPIVASREAALAMSGHVVLLARGPLSDYRDLVGRARALAGVAAVEPFVFTSASISVVERPNLREVSLKGVEPGGAGAAAMARYTTTGAFTLGPRTIVLGDGLARALGVAVGGEVEVRVSTGAPLRLEVAGLFHATLEAYDRELGYVALATLQDLAGTGDRVTGLELRVADLAAAPAIAKQLEQALGGAPYHVLDYRELNAALFADTGARD